MLALIIILLIGITLAVGVVYARGHARRVVRCPDTGGIAQVETSALNEVLTTLFPGSGFHIEKCTRWPDQAGCAESCLGQIEAAPVDCQLRTIVKKWYEGRSCSLCKAEIVAPRAFSGSCAVMAPNGSTRDWSNVTDEELARVLTIYEPVCWNCHIDAISRRVVPVA
jgi:hypothetical protein